MDDTTNPVDAFIARWQGADGRERANYQLFLTELAAVLGLPAPEPASADAEGGEGERAENQAFARSVHGSTGSPRTDWGVCCGHCGRHSAINLALNLPRSP